MQLHLKNHSSGKTRTRLTAGHCAAARERERDQIHKKNATVVHKVTREKTTQTIAPQPWLLYPGKHTCIKEGTFILANIHVLRKEP